MTLSVKQQNDYAFPREDMRDESPALLNSSEEKEESQFPAISKPVLVESDDESTDESNDFDETSLSIASR